MTPDQVARLQRELHRERRIMEKEQQMEEEQRAKGGAGSGHLKRRSTTIGHRSGHRGPLVLKATLRQGDVNTQVGLECMWPRPSAVWLLNSRMHHSLRR